MSYCRVDAHFIISVLFSKIVQKEIIIVTLTASVV
jgi:hypothetical protein